MAEDEETKQAETPPPATAEAEDATADEDELVEAHVWRASG